MKKVLSILFFIVCLGSIAHASDNSAGLLGNWFAAMKRTATDPTTINIYRPLHVHHARFNYTDEQIARYNETPGGLGLGVSRFEGRIEHTLYAVGFTDSNYKFQGVFGYGWTAKALKPESFFNISGGFTITMQMRHEYNYIPLPLPLPLAGVNAGPIAVQASYVPGWDGIGHVAIIWLKLRIKI